jgi:hypothetical protein
MKRVKYSRTNKYLVAHLDGVGKRGKTSDGIGFFGVHVTAFAMDDQLNAMKEELSLSLVFECDVIERMMSAYLASFRKDGPVEPRTEEPAEPEQTEDLARDARRRAGEKEKT